MKEQEVQFRKRLADLARTAYYREIPVFTDFLDLNELHMVHSFRPEEAGVLDMFPISSLAAMNMQSVR